MKPCPGDTTPNLIHFIQYMFPDGRPVDQWIPRSKDVFDKAAALWAIGAKLEIENNAGTIWMSCTLNDKACDRVCENGPGLEVFIDHLINEAHERWILKS